MAERAGESLLLQADVWVWEKMSCKLCQCPNPGHSQLVSDYLHAKLHAAHWVLGQCHCSNGMPQEVAATPSLYCS